MFSVGENGWRPQRVALTVAVVAAIAWFGLFVFECMALFGFVPDIPAVSTAGDAAFVLIVLATMGFFLVSDPRSIRTLTGALLFGIAGLVQLVPEATIGAWGYDQRTALSYLALLLGLLFVFSRRSAIQSSPAE